MTFKRKVQEMKRDLILEEASALFVKDGYENMKISDLAKNAGVSVGAIYSMFGSKEALYNQFIIGLIEYYIDIMEQELKNLTDPIEMLKVITKIKFSAVIKNKNAIREVIVHDPTFHLHVSSDEDNTLTQMHLYISEKVMEPLSKSFGSNRNPLELFFLFDGITFGMVKYWMLMGGDLMARVDEAVEMFTLLLRKG